MGFYVPIQNAGIVETHVKENDDDDDDDDIMFSMVSTFLHE